jgi:hypothetical protein
LTVHVPWLIASMALILLTFGVLIGAWLYLLTALSGRRIPYVAAARIWFISNLAAYIPAGPGWQVFQMGVMSEEQGIGAIPAATAAMINAIINVSTGAAVALIAGATMLLAVVSVQLWEVWLVLALIAAGLLSLPALLPVVLRVVHDRLKRPIADVRLPARVVLGAVLLNGLAWILYGFALQALSNGIGFGSGKVWLYVAAFAAAYVAGYIVLIVPGGLGVREAALKQLMVPAGLATGPQAAILVVAFRLLLLIVQVLPALLFLGYRRRPSDETSAAG